MLKQDQVVTRELWQAQSWNLPPTSRGCKRVVTMHNRSKFRVDPVGDNDDRAPKRERMSQVSIVCTLTFTKEAR